jgi:hypothetical protein
MKQYRGDTNYLGRIFEFRFCAKNNKEACEILNISNHHLTNYVHYDKIEEPYEGMFVKAYNYVAQQTIGHKDEINFEDAKRIVDEEASKISQSWK